MGRFSTSGARLHELRQPKPANAALRQDRPPQSHASSLGPKHPQSAIRPARREGPTLDVGVIEPPPVPLAQREPEPPRQTRTRRGGQGERSPPPPLGTPPAACPLKRRGAVARDAPLRAARTTSPQNSGRHRLVAGNSVVIPALAGLRESGAPHRLPGISAGKPSKKALHRQPIGETQAKARSVARLRRSFCQNGGLASANRDEHAARQRQHLSKRARKRPWDGQLRRRKCTKSNAAPEAPQERRRGCTRTPRRRRRSGWTRP